MYPAIDALAVELRRTCKYGLDRIPASLEHRSLAGEILFAELLS